MNDLERLKMLKTITARADISTVKEMGKLANDIESLRSMLGDVSDFFSERFSSLWAALEIVAVTHQENGSEPSPREIKDLSNLKESFEEAIDLEIRDSE